MDRALRLRGHAMGALTDPNTASVIWNTPTFATGSAKWTSTLSSKLLLEAGISFNRERYDNLYQPGILAERGTADVVSQRPQERHQHRLPVERVGRAARQLSRPLQPAGVAVVRDRRAQRQGRRRSISSATTAATTTPTPISTRPTERRAAARHGAQHAARSAGEPRRQLRHLRAGLVEHGQADAELRRCASTTSSSASSARRRRSAASPTSPAYDDIDAADVEGLLAARCRRSTTCRATARRRFAPATTSS